MLPALLCLLVFVGCGAAPERQSASQPLEIAWEDGGYRVLDAGDAVLFYRLEPKSLDGRYARSNYIHPLYGLDGEILTEDFPKDHRHHRGVYWTWHQVLIGSVRAGDPWLAQRFAWQLQEAWIPTHGNGLRVKHRWVSPDYQEGRKAILEEDAEVLVHGVKNGHRKIDFDIRLAPLRDEVRLGGSEDDKGYGGFSVRVKMLEGLRFTAAAGPLEPQRTAVEAGDWVDFSADFGGQGSWSGVAVLVHPASTGYPQSWILRSPATPSMQNAVWPGPDAVPLERGREVRLRYRLIVHRGDASNLDLDALSREYAATP